MLTNYVRFKRYGTISSFTFERELVETGLPKKERTNACDETGTKGERENFGAPLILGRFHDNGTMSGNQKSGE